MNLQPKSVLELGAGCGKYGVLLREYLDIGHGRLRKDDWEITIDAVEGFRDYVTPLHKYVYDRVLIEDFSLLESYHFYKGYDLVLMIDSLEHIEKPIGIELLSYLLEHNKNVIVSCPFGLHYQEQGAVYGNEYERHRAHWKPSDFAALGGKELHRGVCTVYRLGKG